MRAQYQVPGALTLRGHHRRLGDYFLLDVLDRVVVEQVLRVVCVREVDRVPVHLLQLRDVRQRAAVLDVPDDVQPVVVLVLTRLVRLDALEVQQNYAPVRVEEHEVRPFSFIICID